MSRLQRLRIAFLLLKVYKTTKILNVVGTEFIFETIKMLTLEIKFIQHKNNNYVWIRFTEVEKRRIFYYETSVYWTQISYQ